MFKRFTYDPLLDSERSIAVTILFSVFLFLNTVTFYNLIVSIIVSSHKKVCGDNVSLLLTIFCAADQGKITGEIGYRPCADDRRVRNRDATLFCEDDGETLYPFSTTRATGGH